MHPIIDPLRLTEGATNSSRLQKSCEGNNNFFFIDNKMSKHKIRAKCLVHSVTTIIIVKILKKKKLDKNFIFL